MNADSLEGNLEKAIPLLLNMARDMTWNKISDNCKFIFTEIKNPHGNFNEQRTLNKMENDKKIPVKLAELIPQLQQRYDDFYEINLEVYRAKKDITIVDFRYYPKSSLDNNYRQKVLHDPPMFHCKVAIPPCLSDKREKFSINWQHNKLLIKWRFFWANLKLKKMEATRNKFENKSKV